VSIFIRRLSFIFAIVIALPLILSFIGKIENEKVYFFSKQFPIVCWFKETTGINCASCGLTRGWISLANGEFSKAQLYNKHSFATFIAAIFSLLIFSFLLLKKEIIKMKSIWLFLVAITFLAIAWIPIVRENIFLFDSYSIKLIT
jgi:hypothetical protein